MPTQSISPKTYGITLNKAFPPGQIRALRGIMAPETQICVSSAIQTANASVVATASTELFIPDLTQGVYVVEAYLALAVANAAHNIAYDFGGGTCTATAVGRSELQITAVASDRTSLAALTTLTDGGTTSAWTGAWSWLTVTVTAPGSLVLRYRQSVSGASASSISVGSILMATKVT